MSTPTATLHYNADHPDYFALLLTAAIEQEPDYFALAEEAEHGTAEQRARWEAEAASTKPPQHKQLTPAEFEALFGA